jgi:hypothetical protein
MYFVVRSKKPFMKRIVIRMGNHQGPDIVAYYKDSFLRLLKVNAFHQCLRLRGGIEREEEKLLGQWSIVKSVINEVGSKELEDFAECLREPLRL